MAKTQTNLWLVPDALEAAKAAARTRGLPLNEYVERLITEDTWGVRRRAMAAAQRVIDGFGPCLDGLEQELHQRAPRLSGSAAA
jgi:hypothetical protein